MSPWADVALVLATLLCSLVAGFLFAFAVVVMPGLRDLDDRGFLVGFRTVDGVIQRGDPLFGVVWVGSALALIAALVLGLGQVAGPEKGLLALATGLYLLGVQLPTITINVPLNNELQALDVAGADEETLRNARRRFEARWNRWNRIRTALAVLTSLVLLVCLART